MASKVSRLRFVIGWVLSLIPALMLLMSATGKLAKPPGIVKAFADLGYPENVIRPLGVVEVCCALLFLFPRTAVLGAILVTGYFGGAIATHVRVGQPAFLGALLFGIFAWLGLLLREPRLEPLLPLRN